MAIFGIGALYDQEDVMGRFLSDGVACVGWPENEAPPAHSILRSLRTGDIIFIKSYSPGAGLFVKVVGLVTDGLVRPVPNLGVGVPVRWVWNGEERIGRLDDKWPVRTVTIYEEHHPEVQARIIRPAETAPICGSFTLSSRRIQNVSQRLVVKASCSFFSRRRSSCHRGVRVCGDPHLGLHGLWQYGSGPADASGTWNLSRRSMVERNDLCVEQRQCQHTAVRYGAGGSTSYTVTLAGLTSVGGLIFQNQAYTLTGGSLNLAGNSPTVTVNANATIASVVTGTNGITTSGNGTLVLSGPSTYTGVTNRTCR